MYISYIKDMKGKEHATQPPEDKTMEIANMTAAQIRASLENAASRGMTMTRERAEQLWTDILLDVDPAWHPVLEARVKILIA